MHKMHFAGMTLAIFALLPAVGLSAKTQLPLLQPLARLEARIGHWQSSAQGDAAPALTEIAAGETLQPGQKGPAVRRIRQLFRRLGRPVKASDVYDAQLTAHVGWFQLKHHLSTAQNPHWGEVGPSTLEALIQAARSKPYDARMGRQLVAFAREHISGGSYQCYFYVARTLHSFYRPFLSGMHAYMAADYLARNPRFREVNVSVAKLPSLPAGAIVVWDKGHSISGHISIADGQGNEISDHISPQMLAHYGGAGARVFLPVKAAL